MAQELVLYDIPTDGIGALSSNTWKTRYVTFFDPPFIRLFH